MLLLAVALCAISLTTDARAQSRDEAREQQAIHEANKVLQEEIKLAFRPQTYVLVDIYQGVVVIKARGVEIHRLPILSWRASEEQPPVGVFRLTARPPVDRPKAKPGEDATEHPIEIQDMPAEYQLVLDPPLTVAVAPPARDHPWLWVRSVLREWWTQAISSVRSVGSPEPRTGPRLRLTLARDAAQSLAWSVTDDMPVLIGRTTLP
jgi:hypothetical protein